MDSLFRDRKLRKAFKAKTLSVISVALPWIDAFQRIGKTSQACFGVIIRNATQFRSRLTTKTSTTGFAPKVFRVVVVAAREGAAQESGQGKNKGTTRRKVIPQLQVSHPHSYE